MAASKTKVNQQLGAAIVEYCITLAILAAIFIVSAGILRVSARERADNSIRISEGMTPCGGEGGLLNTASDECL